MQVGRGGGGLGLELIFWGWGGGVTHLGVCTIENLGIQAIGSWARCHCFRNKAEAARADETGAEALPRILPASTPSPKSPMCSVIASIWVSRAIEINLRALLSRRDGSQKSQELVAAFTPRAMVL
jgi:hypothetical protein